MPDPSANARLSSFTATAMPAVESVLLETPRDQLEPELIRRREPAGDIYAFHSKRIIAPVHQSAVRGKTAAEPKLFWQRLILLRHVALSTERIWSVSGRQV